MNWRHVLGLEQWPMVGAELVIERHKNLLALFNPALSETARGLSREKRLEAIVEIDRAAREAIKEIESRWGLTPQQKVREFVASMGQLVRDRPSLDGYPLQLRGDLIQEELDEFLEAGAARDMVGMIDALVDILYVTYGAAVSLGVELQPFFDEIHRANMAKAGGPRRADGKVLKPEGWQPPDIAGLLARLYVEKSDG